MGVITSKNEGIVGSNGVSFFLGGVTPLETYLGFVSLLGDFFTERIHGIFQIITIFDSPFWESMFLEFLPGIEEANPRYGKWLGNPFSPCLCTAEF